MWFALWPGAAAAATREGAHPAQTEQGSAGPIIRFTEIDVAFSDSYAPPEAGWKLVAAEPYWAMEKLPARPGNIHAVWARMRFDRARVGGDPLALYTQDNREQIMVFLNGKELFRNFSEGTEHVQGWYRPYLIPIPLNALRSGTNEILIRADSNWNLGLGRMAVGPQEDLQRFYSWQRFWRIDGAQAANYVMLALAGAAFLLWLVRRRETELLFLALAGVFWFARDYHYFVPHHSFDPVRFNDVSIYALYFASACDIAFVALFAKVPKARTTIALVFGLGVLMCALNLAGLFRITLIFLATSIVSIGFCIWALVKLRRPQPLAHWILLAVTFALTMSGIHDIGRVRQLNFFDGLGFYVQPYIGLIFCAVFLFSFGRRAAGAFAELETVNQTLEKRVAEARSDLAESEAKRRELEVAQAVDSERTRLMREMHDGIGSNLVTALAIAEQQNQPRETIKTLKRAISDLKITVDSLEPVEGDIVALLANLRHRMARDLKEAGLATKWKAEPCEPLDWLDATNALHVLRIFQEALGNALTHAHATELEIGCFPDRHSGRDGITAYVADNGTGLADGEAAGKGLNNMRVRTEAMHGVFECQSRPGTGTKIAIWLPRIRNGH